MPKKHASVLTEPELATHDKAVKAASAFVNTLTTISTGALVFSIGLSSTAVELSTLARLSLVGSWILFALSIVLGLLTQSTLAMHIKEQVEIFESKLFNGLTQGQQVTFALAAIVLAIVLSTALLAKPVFSDFKVKSVIEAEKRVRACTRLEKYGELTKVELVAGSDAANPEDSSWHLQYESKGKTDLFLDALVSAKDGTVEILPPNRAGTCEHR